MTKLPDHHNPQSQQQLDYISGVKIREADFLAYADLVAKLFASYDPAAARNVALARTHMEDAAMRLIRAIAKPTPPS